MRPALLRERAVCARRSCRFLHFVLAYIYSRFAAEALFLVILKTVRVLY
jgi:hypothetical protein